MIQNWYFFSKTLILYSIPIHPTKRKWKKKKLSTFKLLSFINNFTIQDTQGEVETDARKNCKNEWTKNKHIIQKASSCQIYPAQKRNSKRMTKSVLSELVGQKIINFKLN